MGINTVTETVDGGGDYRWLQSARGSRYPKSGSVDTSTGFSVGDTIKSGTPVTGPIDALTVAASTGTADDLTGFVWHDVTVGSLESEPVAVLTDATIISSFIPTDNDLTDGRYLCDAILPEDDA